MLRSLSVDGLFLSTFPLASYLKAYDTIKFGKHWNGDALMIQDKISPTYVPSISCLLCASHSFPHAQVAPESCEGL